jgi:hypothetical protein
MEQCGSLFMCFILLSVSQSFWCCLFSVPGTSPATDLLCTELREFCAECNSRRRNEALHVLRLISSLTLYHYLTHVNAPLLSSPVPTDILADTLSLSIFVHAVLLPSLCCLLCFYITVLFFFHFLSVCFFSLPPINAVQPDGMYKLQAIQLDVRTNHFTAGMWSLTL